MGSARLNGTLTDDGGVSPCECGFEWGKTTAYGNTTSTQSRTVGQSFSQVILGLDPDTTYHFRAFATNSIGTDYGADRTLTTNPSGALSYWYHLNVKNINLPYEDKDRTKELHVVLKNLSPTAKNEGADGQITVKVDYEPAA